MTDNRNNHPLDPMEDQVLDRYLASLGRLTPGPGFDDRVMARVRINAPVPAPAPSFAAPAVRRGRWPGRGDSPSGAAGGPTAPRAGGGAAIFPPGAGGPGAGLIAVAVPSWQAVLAWITTTVPSVG